MDSGEFNKSIISKLSLYGGKFENAAARMHFERMFSANEILPNGFPPKAIVCIKQIRDPKPFSLRLNNTDLRFSENWCKNISHEIDKLYRKAVRPIREFVPIEAESVVFADHSEMLACLANDFCDGNLMQNWWWKSLFPNLNQAQTVAKIWLDSIEFVPKSLTILAQKQKAVEFVSKLEEAEAENLLMKILQIFGLKKLQIAIFEPLRDSKKQKDKSKIETKNKTAELKKEEELFDRKIVSPFNEFLPEIQTKILSFIRENLLGICILLTKSPRLVRSEKFAENVKHYRENKQLQIKPKTLKSPTENTTKLKKKIDITEIEPISKGKSKKKKITFISTEVSKPAKSENIENRKTVFKTFEEIVDLSDKKTEVEAKKTPSKIVGETEKVSQIASFEETENAEKSTKIKLEKEKISQSKTRKAKQAESEIIYLEDQTEVEEFTFYTQFGGIFYLLNLGLFLDLYRDFTESAADEIDLNIWDFVALLAFDFLGNEFEKDKVWEFLNDLKGNDEAVENEFYPEKDWRISTDWLQTFQNQRRWFWCKNSNRLIVRHPSNFNVIDVEIDRKIENQFEKELENYRQFFDEIEKIEVFEYPKSTVFERWLKNLTDYIKARLLQVLNLKIVAEINEVLFRKNARVNVSATHLEIYFNLADLPLSVRFSGLDRDPGWIPAVGKFVKFHFV
ncbi:MAG TPA: hypothetical protein PKY59_00800 [Pyrinomonadaceae bacterium]|nr:hypothetical protein [Pyrinomonadaceae bacterium]